MWAVFSGATLLVILNAGCGGKGAQPEPIAGEQGSREAVVASDSRAALAGSWSGAKTIPGYGTVVATFTLDSHGGGYYFVSVSGQRLQGPFTLLSWAGGYLVAEAKGHRERVHATHRGDTLWVDHAFIGQVKLLRQ